MGRAKEMLERGKIDCRPNNAPFPKKSNHIWSDSIIYFSPDVNAYVKGKVSGLKIAFREKIERR